MSVKVGVLGARGKMGAQVCSAVDAAPDLELVEPGAPFFVIVGRLTLRGGHASTVTSLMFRRLGRLNASDVDFHRERGAKYRSLLGFDDA